MGQYWNPVNLDKKEFIIDPYMLASGVKLWEQIANAPGVGAALIVLTAAMPEQRGGGDFDLERNWHGPERPGPEYSSRPAPMPPDYQVVAHRTIGRWAGDRIALVGDYTEDSDLPAEFQASAIYGRCRDGTYLDITADVRQVIEHELQGRFVDEGHGWSEWVDHDTSTPRPRPPTPLDRGPDQRAEAAELLITAPRSTRVEETP